MQRIAGNLLENSDVVVVCYPHDNVSVCRKKIYLLVSTRSVVVPLYRFQALILLGVVTSLLWMHFLHLPDGGAAWHGIPAYQVPLCSFLRSFCSHEGS